MIEVEKVRAEFEKWYDSAPEVEFHPGWSLYKDTAYLAFLAGRSSLADAGQVRRAALEEAATYLEAQATCPCNGDAGYCMENDPPRAYAKEIRALSTTQPKDTPCPPIGEEG